MKFWKISYSSSFTVSCDLSDLEWMNDTSFADSHWFLQVKKKSGKNKLVFSIRAVNECPSDALSNFPGWHFPGFPWQPDICAVCSCDWPPLFLLCPRCLWSKRRGFQTETGLWQAPRSDTWTHSMAHRDGGCYHGDQIAFFFFFWVPLRCDVVGGVADVVQMMYFTPVTSSSHQPFPHLSEAFLYFPQFD